MNPNLDIEPAVLRAVENWQQWLIHERRISIHTLNAYNHDLRIFLQFLS